MIIKAINKQVKLTRTGNKPYASVSVQFDEYTEGGKRVWINGFGNKRTWAWKVGDDVQPTVTKEGKYLNFSFDDTDENRIDVYKLPVTVGFVMELLKLKDARTSTPAVEGKGMPLPEDPAPVDDIPF